MSRVIKNVAKVIKILNQVSSRAHKVNVTLTKFMPRKLWILLFEVFLMVVVKTTPL